MTDEQLSVVVQGPGDEHLRATVASVRRVLPAAQLVVSTWLDTDVTGLDADDVVQSPDPGTVIYRRTDGADALRQQNANRMITSTRVGLARAERPIALKLRSDTPVIDDGGLEWLGIYRRRHPELRVLDERVVVSCLYTPPAAALPACLFHPSDCVQLGTTADLRRLWGVGEAGAPVDERANVTWRLGRPDADPRHRWGAVWWPRFFNEQLVWLACLRRAGVDVGYEHNGHVTDALVERSELALVNNFVVVEPWQLGVSFPTFAADVRRSELRTFLWFDAWLASYRRWCDPEGSEGQELASTADGSGRRADPATGGSLL